MGPLPRFMQSHISNHVEELNIEPDINVQHQAIRYPTSSTNEGTLFPSTTSGSRKRRCYRIRIGVDEDSDEDSESEKKQRKKELEEVDLETAKPHRKRAAKTRLKKGVASTELLSDVAMKTRRTRKSPNKKRVRMPEQFKRVRGRFGSLERLAKDIPLDIVFEIFAYLHPLDLLRLSRATKELRCILINKSSEHVWRTARQNVAGLPPLPHDLNEPQYVHLMFEPNCDVCNRKNCCDVPGTIFWTFRMRCCKQCAKTAFPRWNDPKFQNKQPVRYRYDESILPSEIYLHPQRAIYIQVGSHQIADKFTEEYEALSTGEEKALWIKNKKKELCERMEHARLCQEWHQFQ